LFIVVQKYDQNHCPNVHFIFSQALDMCVIDVVHVSIG